VTVIILHIYNVSWVAVRQKNDNINIDRMEVVLPVRVLKEFQWSRLMSSSGIHY